MVKVTIHLTRNHSLPNYASHAPCRAESGEGLAALRDLIGQYMFGHLGRQPRVLTFTLLLSFYFVIYHF